MSSATLGGIWLMIPSTCGTTRSDDIAISRRLPGFRWPDGVETEEARSRAAAGWVRRIAANLAIKSRQAADRRPCRNGSVEDFEDPAPSGPAVDAGPDGERQHLREALDALSDRARMAVLLCHGHGRSVRQVAATMGLSPSGARYLIDRALGFLKR
jgi:RNA polymerase sigma factor (sigma-70 family)